MPTPDVVQATAQPSAQLAHRHICSGCSPCLGLSRCSWWRQSRRCKEDLRRGRSGRRSGPGRGCTGLRVDQGETRGGGGCHAAEQQRPSSRDAHAFDTVAGHCAARLGSLWPAFGHCLPLATELWRGAGPQFPARQISQSAALAWRAGADGAGLCCAARSRAVGAHGAAQTGGCTRGRVRRASPSRRGVRGGAVLAGQLTRRSSTHQACSTSRRGRRRWRWWAGRPPVLPRRWPSALCRSAEGDRCVWRGRAGG
mgnify:CR=1 FL=1